jgi:hypothetical protein
MGWFGKLRKRPVERAPSGGAGRPERTPPRSPYSLQYETIVAQGHERPTPSFGAPTLIWHVAIWPRRRTDDGRACDPHDTAGEKHEKAKDEFERRRLLWVEEIKAFLDRLQARGCRPGGNSPASAAERLRLAAPHDLPWQPMSGEPGDFFKPVSVLEHATAPFTLWWPDNEVKPQSAGCAEALRICVHPEVNADYACISFYMDVGQRWNEVHAADPNSAHGPRRRRLLDAVADIRVICEAQFGLSVPGAAAPVDQPAVPEILQSPDQRNGDQLHEALKAARNLLYVDVWELFSAEMQCRLEDIAGGRGEVFANFCGLVMSTNGLDTTGRPAYQPKGQATASVGTATFANFSRDDRFQADGAEANAVVKAFWPFVRRITPRSDYREFVACGVLGWRAIYITALGSSSQYTERHERNPSAIEEGEHSIRVRPDLLPGNEKQLAAASEAGHFDSLVRARVGRAGNNHPVRYLLLAKHEPHPRQIGRIAERINTMGTMRLYALKDWTAIRNADPYIRILGQELDQITENWGSNRSYQRTANTKTSARSQGGDQEAGSRGQRVSAGRGYADLDQGET